MVFPHTQTKKFVILLVALALQLPLNGFAAGDITQRELLQQLDRNSAPFILDVRKPDEFAAGHVPGAQNIPHTEIAARLDELRDKQHSEVVVYCESGRRAAIAIGILEKAGFSNIRHLDGDMRAWRKSNLPQEE